MQRFQNLLMASYITRKRRESMPKLLQFDVKTSCRQVGTDNRMLLICVNAISVERHYNAVEKIVSVLF